MEDHDADPDDPPDAALISEAQKLARMAVLLSEHPKVKAEQGNSGLCGTVRAQAELILHLVQESEACASPEEFDVIHYLIYCHVEGLVVAVSRLRIP